MEGESVWCGNGGLRVKEKACEGEGEGVRVGISLTVRKKRECVFVFVFVFVCSRAVHGWKENLNFGGERIRKSRGMVVVVLPVNVRYGPLSVVGKAYFISLLFNGFGHGSCSLAHCDPA